DAGVAQAGDGAGAEVGVRVGAVDDDRPGRVELLERVDQVLEREVHGTGKMRAGVLVRGEHVDELGVLLVQKPQELLTVDALHGHSLSLPVVGQTLGDGEAPGPPPRTDVRTAPGKPACRTA